MGHLGLPLKSFLKSAGREMKSFAGTTPLVPFSNPSRANEKQQCFVPYARRVTLR